MKASGRLVWDLEDSPLLKERDIRIKWNQFFEDNGGSRYQRHTLMTSSKQILLLMCGQSTVLPRVLSQSTVLGQWTKIRTFVRWMVRRNIWKFSDLTFNDVIDFLRERRPRSNPGSDLKYSSSVAEGTITSWIELFEFMWDMRSEYDHSLRVSPYSMMDELRAQIKTRPISPWKSLTEDVTLILIRDAFQWLADFGPFLSTVTEASWLRSQKTVGWVKRRRREESHLFYSEIGEQDVYKKLCTELNYSGTIYKTISVALSVTEGACAFLLLVLVGMRASELLALNHDCLVFEDVDSRRKLGFIRGVAAKRQGRGRRWIAGEHVQNVIGTLSSLSGSTHRRDGESHALLLSRSAGSPLFWCGSLRKRWGVIHLNNRLKAFACHGLRDGKVQVRHLHPHMLRKTFAQLAVLRDKSRLDAVAVQLGHSFKYFTDGKYVGVDHALTTLLAQEDRKDLSKNLERILTARAIGGKASPMLDRVRAQAASFRGRATLISFIDRLIDQGVLIAPCNWGYCIYSREFSACGGNERGPNEVTRSPDVCAGCNNLFITEKHVFWWSARAREQEEFLMRDGLPSQTRELVERKLTRTRTVLSRIVSSKMKFESLKDE